MNKKLQNSLSTRYLIVGSSAAGLFAAEAIREKGLKAEIIVLTNDKQTYYSRCLTTYYLAGDIEEKDLFLRTQEELQALNLDIHFNCSVSGLNPKDQILHTATGEDFYYDKCLIATGASPVVPDIPGFSLPEVFTLRHLENANSIKALFTPGSKAVISGGGLVSLKSAYALRKQGLEVKVIVSSSHILSQMLDSQAASILGEHLKAHGIDILYNSSISQIVGEDHVKTVHLSDGSTIPADLVIVGKGVHPNIAPFINSGLEISQGILVNEKLETNLPNVYAAGDVVEAWDRIRQKRRINAIWPNATQQGRIAGLNMTGENLTYQGSIAMNAVDFFGLRIISAGITKPENESLDVEEVTLPNSNGLSSYQRLVWHNDMLKGFVLLGNTEKAGILTALLQAQKPLTPKEQDILRKGKWSKYLLTQPMK